MVLASMLKRRFEEQERQREEQRLQKEQKRRDEIDRSYQAGFRDGFTEGRRTEREAWETWNARREIALGNNLPFDQPPPSRAPHPAGWLSPCPVNNPANG